MNGPKLKWQAIIFLILFLSLPIAASVLAEPPSKEEGSTATKGGHLRTSDLPEPLQEIGNAIQRIGNEISKGVSKVSKILREAPEKMEKSKTKEK